MVSACVYFEISAELAEKKGLPHWTLQQPTNPYEHNLGWDCAWYAPATLKKGLGPG